MGTGPNCTRSVQFGPVPILHLKFAIGLHFGNEGDIIGAMQKCMYGLLVRSKDVLH